MNLLPIIPGYTTLIYETGRQAALVMLAAFLITFIIARGYTRIARRTGWGSAHLGGVHTHHLVFGIVISLVAGALQFSFLPAQDSPIQLLLAATFGAGAALTLDEFALLFHLDDVYWEKEGRKSVDAVVIAVLLGILFLLHTAPFGQSDDVPREALTIILLINLTFVVVAGLKGKFFVATFGVFIPLLAMVGAIRLAEPGSLWAHKFYNQSSSKLKKSKERYAIYEQYLRPKKERFWDLIGGKIGRQLQ